MADKSLEIKLRATGGDAAAAEVEQLVEATESLNAEVAKTSEMTPMFDWGAPIEEGRQAVSETTTALEGLGATVTETAPAIDGLTDAIDTSSKSTGGFGAKLLTLAGGPIGIATTAITTLIGAWIKWRNAVEATKTETDRILGSLKDQRKAIAETATATEKLTEETATYLDQLDDLAEKQRAAAEEYDATARRTNELAEAQDRLNKSNIDADVASGVISAEEGAARKIEVDIDAARRENDAVKEKAAKEKARADEEVRAAKTAESAAEADLAAAEEAAKKEEGRRDKFLDRSQTTAMSAQGVMAPDASGEGITAMLGGKAELERRLGALTGVAGMSVAANKRDGDATASLDQAGDSAIVKKALADQLNKEAAAAAKAAAAREDEVKVANDLVEAKRAELEAVRAAVEARKKEADAAASKVTDAEQSAAISEGIDIPIAKREADATRKQGDLRAQKEATQAAAKAEADQRAAQAAAATEAANTAAREASAQAARMAGNAAGNGGVPASVVGAVENAAAKLADGTTEQEIAGVMGRIVNALEGVPAAQQSAMRAALDPLMSRLSNIESQLRNGTRN
jgi:hypothetical protein